MILNNFIKIEVEERFFDKILIEHEIVSVIFTLTFCFNNYFILVINDKIITKLLDNM